MPYFKNVWFRPIYFASESSKQEKMISNLVEKGIQKINMRIDGNYNYANRLVSLTNGVDNYNYQYNGLGDRIQQTVNGVTTTYVLDLNTGLTQVLSDGTDTYLYGLSRIGEEDTAWDYYLGDALGSVRQLADFSGAISLAQTYQPYGEVWSSYGNDVSGYAFTGEALDPSGLIFLRARYLDMTSGRFISRDTWGGIYQDPLSFNRWMYVEGNPVNYTDPTGKFTSLLAEYVNGYSPDNPKIDSGFLEREKILIDSALWDVARAYTRVIEPSEEVLKCLKPIIQYMGLPYFAKPDPVSTFVKIHNGRIRFLRLNNSDGAWGFSVDENSIHIRRGGTLSATDGDDLRDHVARYYPGATELEIEGYYKRFIIHEVGHAFDHAMSEAMDEAVEQEDELLAGVAGLDPYFTGNGFYQTKAEGWQWRLNTGEYRDSPNEIFADMFLGWVYNKWEINRFGQLTDPGSMRATFMDEIMKEYINDFIHNN